MEVDMLQNKFRDVSKKKKLSEEDRLFDGVNLFVGKIFDKFELLSHKNELRVSKDFLIHHLLNLGIALDEREAKEMLLLLTDYPIPYKKSKALQINYVSIEKGERIYLASLLTIN